MDINEKLNIISFKNQQQLNMDSTQTKDKQINDLYNQMLAAQENVKLAPIEAEKAKQKYYRFIGEKDNSKQLDAVAFGNEIANNHQNLLNSIHQKIQYYDSQYKYLNQLDVILFDYYKQILKQLHTVKSELNQTSTNDRKIYYINEELSTIDAWNQVLSFILIFILYKVILKYIDDYDYQYLFYIFFIIFMITPLFYNTCVWVFNIFNYLLLLKPFTYTNL